MKNAASSAALHARLGRLCVVYSRVQLRGLLRRKRLAAGLHVRDDVCDERGYAREGGVTIRREKRQAWERVAQPDVFGVVGGERGAIGELHEAHHCA